MESKSQFLFSSLLIYFLSVQAHELQTYIVQLHPKGLTKSAFNSKLEWHLSFLEKAISSEGDTSSRFLYSYHSAMEGFAARLTTTELEVLNRFPEVIAVRPDTRYEVHTTYSYKFLGLSTGNEGAWLKSGYGRGSVIGLLDTGVWPESPSFSDIGMPSWIHA